MLRTARQKTGKRQRSNARASVGGVPESQAASFFLGLVAEYYIYAIAGLIPLTVISTSDFILFETPKAALLHIFTLAALLAWSGGMLQSGVLLIRRPPFLLPILAYYGVYVAATAFSLSPVLSIFGIVDRGMGLINLTNFILLYFLAFNILSNRERQLRCLKIIVLSTGVMAALGVLQFFGIDPFHLLPPLKGQRVGSTLGNPDYCTPVVVLALPVALAFLWRKRLWYAAPAVLLFMMFLFSLPIPKLTGEWVMQVPRESGAELQEVPSGVVETLATVAVERVEVRKGLWEAGIKAALDHPLLGTGPNTYRNVFTQYEPLYYVRMLPDFREDKAHNEFIEVAQSTGFLGLAAYLWMLGAALFYLVLWLWRRKVTPPPPRGSSPAAQNDGGREAKNDRDGEAKDAGRRKSRGRPPDKSGNCSPLNDSRCSSPLLQRQYHVIPAKAGIQKLLPDKSGNYNSWLWRSRENVPFVLAIAIGAVGYMAYTFMLFHTVAAFTIFWILLAVGAGLCQTASGEPATKEIRVLKWLKPLTAVLFIAIFTWTGFQAVRPVLADLSVAEGHGIAIKDEKSARLVADLYRRAAEWNGYEYNYLKLAGQTISTLGARLKSTPVTGPEFQEAFYYIDRAARQEPHNATVYYNRAIIYGRSGRDVSEVIADLNRAIELYPYYILAYNMLGDVERARGNYVKAIEARKKALAITPDDAGIMVETGYDSLQAERFPEAIEMLEKGIKAGDGTARARFLLGGAYELSGNREKARQAYEDALRVEPGNLRARDGLIRVTRGL